LALLVGIAGAAVRDDALVVVGSGVLATVESPDPQPASASTTAATIIGTHFTTAQGTASTPGRRAGAAEERPTVAPHAAAGARAFGH